MMNQHVRKVPSALPAFYCLTSWAEGAWLERSRKPGCGVSMATMSCLGWSPGEALVGGGERQGCGCTPPAFRLFHQLLGQTDERSPRTPLRAAAPPTPHACLRPHPPPGWPGRARGDQHLLRTPVKSSWSQGCPEQLAAAPLCPEFCAPQAGCEPRALPAPHPTLPSSPGSRHVSPERLGSPFAVALAQIWVARSLQLAWFSDCPRATVSEGREGWGWASPPPG